MLSGSSLGALRELVAVAGIVLIANNRTALNKLERWLILLKQSSSMRTTFVFIFGTTIWLKAPIVRDKVPGVIIRVEKRLSRGFRPLF
jgi:hypothetical protein